MPMRKIESTKTALQPLQSTEVSRLDSKDNCTTCNGKRVKELGFSVLVLPFQTAKIWIVSSLFVPCTSIDLQGDIAKGPEEIENDIFEAITCCNPISPGVSHRSIRGKVDKQSTGRRVEKAIK